MKSNAKLYAALALTTSASAMQVNRRIPLAMVYDEYHQPTKPKKGKKKMKKNKTKKNKMYQNKSIKPHATVETTLDANGPGLHEVIMRRHKGRGNGKTEKMTFTMHSGGQWFNVQANKVLDDTGTLKWLEGHIEKQLVARDAAELNQHEPLDLERDI